MHLCNVIRKHKSGLVDARSMSNDLVLKGINISFTPGTDPAAIKAGDYVLVLTDYHQHYIMGKVNLPKDGADSDASIKEYEGDFGELDSAQKIYSTDNMGNICQVIVDAGAGAIFDGGGVCTIHANPAINSLDFYSERMSVTTAPFTSRITHVDGECSSRYEWRSEVSGSDIENDLLDIDSNNLNKSVVVEIGASADIANLSIGDSLNINMGSDGSVSLRSSSDVEIESSGASVSLYDDSIIVNSGSSEISVSSDGHIKITTTGGVGAITLDPLGRIFLGQSAGVDLLSVLDSLLIALQSAQTVTALGSQPLLPINAVAPLLQAQIQLIKGSA